MTTEYSHFHPTRSDVARIDAYQIVGADPKVHVAFESTGVVDCGMFMSVDRARTLRDQLTEALDSFPAAALGSPADQVTLTDERGV